MKLYSITKHIPDVITRFTGRQILLTKKNSPTILFAAGVVGVVGTAVLASRATLKAEAVLERTSSDLAAYKGLVEDPKFKYNQEDCNRDIVTIYARAGVDLAKLYGPAIVVGGFTIAALTGSHHILSKRNTALMASYAALDKTFAQYRARVVDSFGEDADKHLRYDLEKRAATIETEDGKTKDVEVYRVAPTNDHSLYARFFDQRNPNWEPTPEYNRIFLRCQQQYANDILQSRGHVFLNDVYDSLGMQRSTEGAVVGWVISKDGDNFIDFGLFNGNNPAVRDFINGREGSILLDFNVDGIIYDKI